MRLNLIAWAVPVIALSAFPGSGGDQASPAGSSGPLLRVQRTADFAVDGKGSGPSWSKAEWQALQPRGADGPGHVTRVKVLYSPTGLYVLIDG